MKEDIPLQGPVRNNTFKQWFSTPNGVATHSGVVTHNGAVTHNGVVTHTRVVTPLTGSWPTIKVSALDLCWGHDPPIKNISRQKQVRSTY